MARRLPGQRPSGLDLAKLWVALDRGAATTEDIYSGHWDLWSVVDEPVADLRRRYGIPPLDPADAALADDEIRCDAFDRPGLAPPPRLSAVGVADRPPAGDG